MSASDATPETSPSRPAAPSLNDTDLAEAAGGMFIPDGGGGTTTIKNARGSECGVRDNMRQIITYRPCPRCGKPMHTDFYTPKWYCDPCNFSEFNPRRETWTGTVEELIAASN